MPFNAPIPNRKGGGKSSSPFGALVQAEKLMQIAFILPCAAFIGWLGGTWAARSMNQKWPVAVGIIFGAAAGLVIVIRMAMDAMNDSGNPDEKPDGKGSGQNGS